jgi:hypothetical protein
MKHFAILFCRAVLVLGFPAIMAWTIVERLISETRSTWIMLRCDFFEGLHYFRKCWRQIPVAVTEGMRARRSRSPDNA